MSNLISGIGGARTRAVAMLNNARSLRASAQALTRQPAGFAATMDRTASSANSATPNAAARQTSILGQLFGANNTPIAAQPPAANVFQPTGQTESIKLMEKTGHYYANDPVDDAYWAKQPAPVQQLREIDDPDQRKALATQLAAQGYSIDVPIMVWGFDAGKTMALRQQYGYAWVPSALQNPIELAPGLNFPNMPSYDPSNPPPGSIIVQGQS